jgi:antibiotic biosynthesis monooxygenase (ABM) superfamily enzyme
LGFPQVFPRFHLGLLSRVASYCVSYSTPSGLGPLVGFSPSFPQVSPGAIISRSELLRFVFNPFWVGAVGFPKFFPRFHLGLLSRVASYCVSYSTPSGLGPLVGFSPSFPQVSPGAIISLSELLRFVFNPFGVGAVGWVFPKFSPSFTQGYSYSTPSGLGPLVGFSPSFPQVSPGAIRIQPLWGWGRWLGFPQVFPRFHQLLLSRVASYCVSYSTPSGLGPLVGFSPSFPQVSPGAIISLSELLRFVFNPFGVGAVGWVFPKFSPGFTWGYSLFTFNPFGVVAPRLSSPRFHLGLFTFNPFGVGALAPFLSPGCT